MDQYIPLLIFLTTFYLWLGLRKSSQEPRVEKIKPEIPENVQEYFQGYSVKSKQECPNFGEEVIRLLGRSSSLKEAENRIGWQFTVPVKVEFFLENSHIIKVSFPKYGGKGTYVLIGHFEKKFFWLE